MLEQHEEQQIDRAIQNIVGTTDDLVRAVQRFIGKDQLGVMRETLISRAEAQLPEALAIHVAHRVRDLKNSNPDSPRARLG